LNGQRQRFGHWPLIHQTMKKTSCEGIARASGIDWVNVTR
jgi:hypothetical protein